MENIKIQSSTVPTEQLTYEQWAKQLRVSVLWNRSKQTDKANQMMSLWDDRAVSKYTKKLQFI